LAQFFPSLGLPKVYHNFSLLLLIVVSRHEVLDLIEASARQADEN